MPPPVTGLKPGSLKDPAVAALFSTKDPESRYDDLREIGHGSFGAVYFAFDKDKSETVAVKKMAFSGKQAAEKWTDIIKEVSFLNKIKHPNIVQYKACFLKEHTCWLVMEYCIGSTADIVDVLRKGLKEVEIGAVCSQTLEALHYLHSMQRIHRDVKAGNILLSDAGVVKLADFGSASLASPAQTFIGTPFFMAPEVILAMDEGHYAEKADIWSLGITCIELAERRPPLFNMNAMSALYHIAQNDPPTLSPIDDPEQPQWSERFVSFVEQCLRKDPDQRLSTAACMNHSFVTMHRSPSVIPDLIARTKKVVQELDNFQYKKMRKLMYLDEDRQNQEDGEDTTTGGGSSATDGLSVGLGGADSASSRSNSLASFRSIHSSGHPASLGGVSARQRLPIPESMWQRETTSGERLLSEENRTVVNVGSGSSGDGERGRSPDEDTAAARAEGGRTPLNRESPPKRERNIKEDMATLRKSKFSTLRTTKLISREQEEYARENNVAEQMSGYKRLRQTHHKELQQLEEKCKVEMEALRLKMDRELETLHGNYAKELQRVRNAHRAELDKKKKENEEGEKKLRKQIMSRQQQEMRAFANAQLKEYKYNKELAKSGIKERCRGLPRATLEAHIKDTKNELHKQRVVAEQTFERQLKDELEREIGSYRRSALIRLHTLEDQLETDEINIRVRQMEATQAMQLSHHEMTTKVELAQMHEIQHMKKRHQEVQHEAEYRNQSDYTDRVKSEMSKRHALQSKQQPRELKLKEQQIRKQYRQAVKTQTRQFKLWLTQMVQSATVDERKDLENKLKEDQKRKIALLAAQYESQIENMVQEKTVKLEAWQEDEQKQLNEQLSKELEELKAYQTRQRQQLDQQITKERVAIDDRISLRRSVLEEKLNDQREEMQKIGDQTRNVRKERHRNQFMELDEDCGTSTAL